MRSPESAPAQEQLKPAIAGGQKWFRRRIFRAIGGTVDLGMDTGEFLLESSAWLAGRTIPASLRTVRALYRGVTDKPYRHAA